MTKDNLEVILTVTGHRITEPSIKRLVGDFAYEITSADCGPAPGGVHIGTASSIEKARSMGAAWVRESLEKRITEYTREATAAQEVVGSGNMKPETCDSGMPAPRTSPQHHNSGEHPMQEAADVKQEKVGPMNILLRALDYTWVSRQLREQVMRTLTNVAPNDAKFYFFGRAARLYGRGQNRPVWSGLLGMPDALTEPSASSRKFLTHAVACACKCVPIDYDATSRTLAVGYSSEEQDTLVADKVMHALVRSFAEDQDAPPADAVLHVCAYRITSEELERLFKAGYPDEPAPKSGLIDLRPEMHALRFMPSYLETGKPSAPGEARIFVDDTTDLKKVESCYSYTEVRATVISHEELSRLLDKHFPLAAILKNPQMDVVRAFSSADARAGQFFPFFVRDGYTYAVRGSTHQGQQLVERDNMRFIPADPLLVEQLIDQHYQKAMGLLVAGFSRSGKTYAAGQTWHSALGDVSVVNPSTEGYAGAAGGGWPKNYIDHVKELLKHNDVVVIPLFSVIAQELNRQGIEFIAVTPEPNAVKAFSKRDRRLRSSADHEKSIEAFLFAGAYRKVTDCLNANTRRWNLGPDDHLSDVLPEIVASARDRKIHMVDADRVEPPPSQAPGADTPARSDAEVSHPDKASATGPALQAPEPLDPYIAETSTGGFGSGAVDEVTHLFERLLPKMDPALRGVVRTAIRIARKGCRPEDVVQALTDERETLYDMAAYFPASWGDDACPIVTDDETVSPIGILQAIFLMPSKFAWYMADTGDRPTSATLLKKETDPAHGRSDDQLRRAATWLRENLAKSLEDGPGFPLETVRNSDLFKALVRRNEACVLALRRVDGAVEVFAKGDSLVAAGLASALGNETASALKINQVNNPEYHADA
jgi:hypothetical protein